MTENKNKMTYRDAGVDIDEGAKAVEFIKKRMKSFSQKNVLSGIGGFGGIIDISKFGYKEPVLVSSIDGVGTKTKVASVCGKYEGIGEDIVSHCINDIAVQGAKPLFFMDYIGVGKLEANLVDKVIAGILKVCTEEDCILLGGETAEMPDVYFDNEFDIVGCITGIMEKQRIITGKSISADDIVIGLPSTGLHTNGFSLARKVLLGTGKYSVDDVPSELGMSIADALLVPHKCYGKIIHDLCDNFSVHGMAHITGGGMIDNIPRILHNNLDVIIDSSSWPVLPIFKLIEKTGNIDKLEMFRVFNMGIGLTFFVNKNESEQILEFISERNYEPYVIGKLSEGSKKVIIN